MTNRLIKVEIGQKIRNWTVIEFDEKNPRKSTYYICECKCGKRSSKAISDLIRTGPKQCKSCACKERNFAQYAPPLKDLTGQKFGKWTVIERILNGKRGGYWKCQCECGAFYEIFGGELRRGKSKQCKNCVDHHHFTHGMATRGKIASEYNSWSQMKTRCLNPQDKRFYDWGGRGITIFHEWIDSFEKFFAYMGPKPSPKHSIDRINNDGNYEPGNVRWASPKEQANNRKRKSYTKLSMLISKCENN